MTEDGFTEQVPELGATSAQRGLLGRVLGRFTVVERLGFGGSSEVYRAEQLVLGRSVVVKVLRDETLGVANRIERFLREARLASRLDHPYAAHIYQFGAEPDHVLWLAMEYVRGSTLDAVVRDRGPIPATTFWPWFARLCEVVHSAHELGIIHRDLKGSNAMVIERSGQLLPKLLDFGIAKAGLDGDVTPAVDGAALTQEGMMIGTPNYMSPEQWRSPAEVDARADIYALGVLAYHGLSGRVPFANRDRAALRRAHVFDPPPPLHELSTPVAEVVLRALAKNPHDRWQDALAFAAALRDAASRAGRRRTSARLVKSAIDHRELRRRGDDRCWAARASRGARSPHAQRHDR